MHNHSEQRENLEDDFGPLPKADKTDSLQRVSLVALERALPADEFIFRQELVHDFGVDGSIEVLLGGCATNMRAQVQLKARSGTTENKDGSVSVSIDTANLNHLLNGTCPVYVLYRAETGELRYVFARNEWKRLSKTKPDWRRDSTVTVRFTELMDTRALGQIRKSILAEAKLQRKLWERLLLLAPAITADIHVAAEEFEVSDPLALADSLASQGMQLVTAGLARTAIERGRQIPEQMLAARPIVRVVLAFAEYSEGHYSEAEAHLRDALADVRLLGSDDQSFAWYLHHTISYATGRIGRDEFFAVMSKWRSAAPDSLVSQYDFVRAWELYGAALQQGDPVAIDAAVRQLRMLLAALTSAGAPELRQQAQFAVVQLNGQELTTAYVDAQAQAEFRHRNMHTSPEIAEWQRRWDEWRARVRDLSREAGSRGNLRLVCEADLLLTHAELVVLRLDALRSGQHNLSLPELRQRAQQVVDTARSIRCTELELQGQLQLAEIADAAGDTTGADEIAEDVHKRADLYRFAGLQRVAKRMLEGEDRFPTRIAEIGRFQSDDGASYLRNVDERQLRGIAYESCKTFGIPTTRADNFLASLIAEKVVLEDQVAWCKFLRYKERRPSHADIARLFREPTEKLIQCEKLGHASRFPHIDGRVVLRAFKETYCHNCARRTADTVTA